jgi:hypothetical protein
MVRQSVVMEIKYALTPKIRALALSFAVLVGTNMWYLKYGTPGPGIDVESGAANIMLASKVLRKWMVSYQTNFTGTSCLYIW